ncbi:aminotransferase class I/II-fold pyridoxal phosphate-dependent enzyme [Globicatella sulfidifaciens]|uniref:threonine aldolase family protein n=1 Tax=Globicatella sulfidifaciens TaxID=136093 RepID=UPI002890838A|nr:aminotransferase class I/II-fold pyridoxal phosphate-dependent enzyme [Globicatella sulfidifaciens]MDT2767323.1 aminotransferase class I/II-fold pyridoxal phosphate-dependent enzyme [Globicatella sulfidifaciens]
MLYFQSDYILGAHPTVLEALVKTNLEPLAGYGTDPYTESASQKIKQACQLEEAEVYLLTGGTQTNKIVIDTMLMPYEGVIAADTGHIAVHEAGAIEHSGHKVLTVPQYEGKLNAQDVRQLIEFFYADSNQEHMVYPGMLYISHPTEYGTLYSKAELEELSALCKEFDIPLFVDGARLAYGLASNDTDVDLATLTKLVDVFYIGGTKVGALAGEAVVFTKNNMPKRFNTRVKQFGAMLAKGRLLSVQFDALFTNDLYFKLGEHAIDMAEQLKVILREKNYPFYLASPTNQQFVVVTKDHYEKIAEIVTTGFWETLDENHIVIRFATSWSTTQEDIDQLKELLPHYEL